MNRINISSGSPWEPIIGYSRAVKIGPWIAVSGTTATGPTGTLVGIGSVETQTRQALSNLQKALQKAGADLQDVIRTRLFVKDISEWEKIARVHGSFFETIRPATTLIQVSAFIDPEMLIEIEADAFVSAEDKKDS
jgi:enamine deaminase RidA (YjgF/YER057c/UK114 family)